MGNSLLRENRTYVNSRTPNDGTGQRAMDIITREISDRLGSQASFVQDMGTWNCWPIELVS
ncbi:hypothetical protein MDA_GLEAN10010949 [Myotis davidii]|uniref:Uncharacterized protein n=1 Tax=Myotis davidii TaxID=225400 RepID=L5LWE8_MYODS|nr:hypothetical protein MDA_GLEAN10010949 [Myotis davidii]